MTNRPVARGAETSGPHASRARTNTLIESGCLAIQPISSEAAPHVDRDTAGRAPSAIARQCTRSLRRVVRPALVSTTPSKRSVKILRSQAVSSRKKRRARKISAARPARSGQVGYCSPISTVHAAANCAAGWASANGCRSPYLDYEPTVVTRHVLDDEAGRHKF